MLMASDYDQSPGMDHAADAEKPPPRAFAQGTGVVLQIVGGLMFISSSCVCASAFLWSPQWELHEAEQAMDEHGIETTPWRHLRAQPAKLGMMLAVISTTVGGLALVVFGLGMQSDKPRSAVAAMVANLLLLIVLIVAGTSFWLGDVSISALLWHGVLTFVVCALFGFTFYSWRQVVAHPPTGGLNVVPGDFDPKRDLDAKL